MASPPSRSSGTASRLHGLTPATASLVRDAAARIARGDLDNAERVMTGVLALAPDHAEALRLGGWIDHRRGRLDDAAERYRRALESRPDDASVLAQWGELKIDQGHGDEGLALLRRGCDLQPREADLWFRLGVQLDRQGHHQAAVDAAARVLRIDRAHPIVRMLIARNLQALGRIDDAAAEYRQVIAERGARAWQAWFALVDLKTTRLDARETQALERIAGDPAHSSEVRATLDFALGKVCEDAGRHAEALAAFKRANTAKRRSLQWNSRTYTQHVDAIIAAFAKQPVPVRASGSTS
ncbi:MAG: tetratricopeptide repeat protein, partial [Dokdonella sp.]